MYLFPTRTDQSLPTEGLLLRIITPELVTTLRKTYRLRWKGIHGVPHWSRVRRIGLDLAKSTGASPSVIEYFAFLHDVCRQSDGNDPFHGKRAASFAKRIRDQHIQLDEHEFDLLLIALESHTHGTHHPDITVATCWDADRLDLGRVGIKPDPTRLCTAAGRDSHRIEAAWVNACRWSDTRWLTDYSDGEHRHHW